MLLSKLFATSQVNLSGKSFYLTHRVRLSFLLAPSRSRSGEQTYPRSRSCFSSRCDADAGRGSLGCRARIVAAKEGPRMREALRSAPPSRNAAPPFESGPEPSLDAREVRSLLSPPLPAPAGPDLVRVPGPVWRLRRGLPEGLRGGGGRRSRCGASRSPRACAPPCAPGPAGARQRGEVPTRRRRSRYRRRLPRRTGSLASPAALASESPEPELELEGPGIVRSSQRKSRPDSRGRWRAADSAPELPFESSSLPGANRLKKRPLVVALGLELEFTPGRPSRGGHRDSGPPRRLASALKVEDISRRWWCQRRPRRRRAAAY
jgi:hypothetical protein